MARYFSKPRAWVGTDFGQAYDDTDYSRPMVPDLYVPEHEATDTGLLDARGDSIWRAPRPVGFGRDDEW